ncbi:TetR/AcrR family transcriptional regulator [Atopomonas sediminilitoris]|uniref:TetR/AcrR family transcriptional regulator n=1 Tax=Atopomonas sediminilitoris TaxID=2919919 RepID=UPI001F4EC226|nr:TetR/AcrR family transcriptional regulator [Atopomonas sediminilitoris]MCJ8170036.1 TetR/AcrR family transcriptional regulator [Atopomonas sediminilitoris]
MTKKPRQKPGRPKDLEKKQAVLDAAKSLFLSQGYDATSMDAIAQAAGVSKLTLYSHFSDKDNLFSQSVRSHCEAQMPSELFRLKPDQDIAEQLGSIAKALVALIYDPEAVALHRLIIAASQKDNRLAHLFFDAGPKRMLGELNSLLRAACDAGYLVIPDTEQAADEFFCLVKGLRHMRILTGCSEVPASLHELTHLESALALFLKAYRA